jgi:hypothetical protein
VERAFDRGAWTTFGLVGPAILVEVALLARGEVAALGLAPLPAFLAVGLWVPRRALALWLVAGVALLASVWTVGQGLASNASCEAHGYVCEEEFGGVFAVFVVLYAGAPWLCAAVGLMWGTWLGGRLRRRRLNRPAPSPP